MRARLGFASAQGMFDDDGQVDDELDGLAQSLSVPLFTAGGTRLLAPRGSDPVNCYPGEHFPHWRLACPLRERRGLDRGRTDAHDGARRARTRGTAAKTIRDSFRRGAVTPDAEPARSSS
jgi:hypothetical protein